MDAFNHSNPFESHVIYVRDYRNDHIRLFTIKQADFDTIKAAASPYLRHAGFGDR